MAMNGHYPSLPQAWGIFGIFLAASIAAGGGRHGLAPRSIQTRSAAPCAPPAAAAYRGTR